MTGPCDWLLERQAQAIILAAFKQACQEFGIPPHQGGECPPGCECKDLADAVEARAIEIIEAKLGRALPEVAP